MNLTTYTFFVEKICRVWLQHPVVWMCMPTCIITMSHAYIHPENLACSQFEQPNDGCAQATQFSNCTPGGFAMLASRSQL
jgi:hypothetical protein